jgi:hypothetical protein
VAQKSKSPADFSVPEALWYLCLGAGLTLAPLPALHVLPEEFIYFLFESPVPIRARLAMPEPFWFTMLGLPITAIFLAWALPGAQRPGLPPRSIGLLWFLVAYNPLRHLLERYFYGELVARLVVAADQSSATAWTVRHLDTPLLIALAVAAVRRRGTLQSLPKILFHWALFVCALWAAGPPLLDLVFYRLLSFRVAGI